MEELMERMCAAAASLERAAELMAERQVALAAEAEQSVGRIVATVESQREAELAERLRMTEVKLAEAEGRIAELAAAASSPVAGAGRKTLSSGMTAMLAKQGISTDGLQAGRIEAGSLDAALTSLSIEQRFAVKAELLRAGLLG
ncbi:MAG: hypothetical protein ACRYFU_14860 [Janthinobacterium lividum]